MKKKDKPDTVVSKVPVFTKSDLVTSKRYEAYRDILQALLKEDVSYTMAQVDMILFMFLGEKGVK